MIRKFVKSLALVVIALIVVAGALYQFFGMRFVMDGGGMPKPTFVESSQNQAERIERHREAQRESAPVPASQPAAETPAEPAPGTAKGETVPEALAQTEEEPSTRPTDFRGPNRDGSYQEVPLLADWPAAGLTPLWKQPVGGGYASFVVARGRAFTIEQRGSQEVVAAYDVPTGRELWTNTWSAEFRETMGGDGPRATPTWSDGRVYALGATGELRVLDDATGKVMWRTNILSARRFERAFDCGLRPSHRQARLGGAR
jgi:hypothetical protein